MPAFESLVSVPDGVPEIVAVTYDLWTLRLSLTFPQFKGLTYVEFEGVAGFRVLDEGSLGEFWGKRVPGWLWRVGSGGWLELESTRPSFVDRGAREFLVLGVNDCVSVLAYADPKVHAPAL